MFSPKSLLTFSFILLTLAALAQKNTAVFVVDSITQTVNTALPFNSPVTILIPLEAKEVADINLIEQYKYHGLSSTITYYTKKAKGNYPPLTIPKQFYSIRSRNGKDTLVLNFRNELLLKPSTAYFIVIQQKKLAPTAYGFFESYSSYKLTSDSAHLTAAKKSLTAYTTVMSSIFGSDSLNFGWFSEWHLKKDSNGLFDRFFVNNIQPTFLNLASAEQRYNIFITNQTSNMLGSLPSLDSLGYVVLTRDTTINKEALLYLMRQDIFLNDLLTDMYLSGKQRNLTAINSGLRKLGCFNCEQTDSKNHTARIANLDNSINQLNHVFKGMHLIRPRFSRDHSVENSIRQLDAWINVLEASKDSLKNLAKLKAGIESRILEEKFPWSVENNDTLYKDFLHSSVVSGNSLINFETRNKVLLTPDFGVVTSSFVSSGKTLDYGIIPYLGFHINFMAVDKDISFNKYKKHWRQYWSFMVGWSLVNLQKDSTYSNFFEKSSLLTGLGYRLSNAVRFSAGTQWLFKDDPAKPGNNRRMVAVPYAGLSFDLNVKQYLNDFVNILSGIGKTKNINKIETQISD